MTAATTARLATMAVALHAVIAAVHGVAHRNLGIRMSLAQDAFIYVVIGATPIVAVVLLWRGHTRPGAALLVVSMAGALLFGVYHHFIAVSPDHIAHLPPGELQGAFQLTAWLLPASEAFAAVVGVLGLRAEM